MENNYSNILVNTAEFIKGRLYFVTLNTDVSPKSTPCAHYFAVDTEQCYDSFYNDFGPLNLSMLYHYCTKLDRKLANPSLKNKKIVHYTGLSDKCRVNAAFLIGSYAIIKLGFDAEQAYDLLTNGSTKDYIDFRDASTGTPYNLSLINCLKALKKAYTYGFFNYNNFDYFEYEHYERVENGDLNWIVPEKFIAFCGPHNKSAIDQGYPVHSPETYFSYFRRHNVTTIIRLNKKAYEANRFVQAGFEHRDLFFVDGGIPNDRILNRFLTICENAKGVIAVHCKAGLGRTGTLIACYIMKHYKFTSEEAIGWIRICRPGSIIAHQQTWLHEKQKQLWLAGDAYRDKKKMSGPIKHAMGIYSFSDNGNSNKIKKNDNNVTGIVHKVDSMELHDKDEQDFKSEEEMYMTQGDRLNKIKAQRIKTKYTNDIIKKPTERRTYCTTKVFYNKTSVLPMNKVKGDILTTNSSSLTTTSTTTTKLSTGNRVLTKRNEVNETTDADTSTSTTTKMQTRRFSQRKLAASLMAAATKSTKINKDETDVLPLKKENLNWIKMKTNKCNEKIENKIEPIIKRGKRTLTLEKDKSSPHSTKVLRRSQTTKNMRRKTDEKLRLPTVVQMNKSI